MTFSPTDLVQIGGWCFAALVLFSIIVGFVRGQLVSGTVYARECERSDAAIQLLDKNTEALASVTDVLQRQGGQLDTLIAMRGRR